MKFLVDLGSVLFQRKLQILYFVVVWTELKGHIVILQPVLYHYNVGSRYKCTISNITQTFPLIIQQHLKPHVSFCVLSMTLGLLFEQMAYRKSVDLFKQSRQTLLLANECGALDTGNMKDI